MTDNVLAIVPARGGSKRLPGKNIKLLHGQPLINWTIKAAHDARCISTVVVSTDDNRIAEIARKAGAQVPFIRPAALSDDKSTSVSVMLHALHELAQLGQQFDWIVLLQPTSPLRTGQHIDDAFSVLTQKESDAVISVCKTEHSPLWCNTLPDDDSMLNFLPESVNKGKRSQDLPDYYRLNGAIYIINVNKLLKQKSIFSYKKIHAFIMKSADSVDIDSELDFEFAQFLMSKQQT